jgi:hypothetical protein
MNYSGPLKNLSNFWHLSHVTIPFICMTLCTSIMLMMTLCPYWFLASWTATVSVSLALTSHTLIKNKQRFSCGSGFNWSVDPEPESGSRQEITQRSHGLNSWTFCLDPDSTGLALGIRNPSPDPGWKNDPKVTWFEEQNFLSWSGFKEYGSQSLEIRILTRSC